MANKFPITLRPDIPVIVLSLPATETFSGAQDVPLIIMFRSVTFAEHCVLLNYYAASSGKLSSTFRNNLSVPSSGFKNSGFLGDS
jgi:hypothetical protein